MGNKVLNEGDSLVIYIKYVLDKETSQIYPSNEEYLAANGLSEGASISLERCLKIAERITGKQANGRGIENIAQICGLSLDEIPHCDTINDVDRKSVV